MAGADTGQLSATASTLVALGHKAATAYERSDLAERLDGISARLADDRARVLVVGEFKAGKSELVNALLGVRALPTDAHRATVVPTVVGHGDPGVVMVADHDDGTRSETRIAPGALPTHVTEAGGASATGWSHAAVALPRDVLAGGLALVDTPGAGGLASPAAMSTMAELPSAEAVLVAHDAARELTAREMAMVRTAAAVCPTVVVVVTRTDLHPHWRRIVEIDRGHLRDAELDVTVVPVSATLSLHAADTDDEVLAAESGVPELTALLAGQVAAGRERRRARLAADEVLALGEALATTFRAELTALTDPERGRELARELEGARARAANLRSRAARWQQTLNDGTADLVSDIDHDLRDRLRSVLGDAEAALDETDPAKTWDQFAPWLQQQTAAAVSTNVVWTRERARWLAERVTAHFAEEGEGALPIVSSMSVPGSGPPQIVDDVDPPADAVGSVPLLAQPDHEKFGLSEGVLTSMRGSYGGVLMVGMATTVAGMALLNPWSIGAGVLLGGKTYFDERGRALRRRRTEAKSAVRRHIDDVIFQEGKNSRDMLRDMQRVLRDHFTRTASELDTSLAAAATAAKAVQATSQSRDRRRADVETELGRVVGLIDRARDLRADAEGDGAPRRSPRATPRRARREAAASAAVAGTGGTAPGLSGTGR